MNQEKYNFTRHSYSEYLRDMMKDMMASSDFADVTLVCEDKKQIKAHRNILSACSPVFKDMLKIDKSSSSIIYLRGVTTSKMQPILQFIYLGEAIVYQEQISEFISVANSFEIKDLDLSKVLRTGGPTYTKEGTERVEINPLPELVDKSVINEQISKTGSATCSKDEIADEMGEITMENYDIESTGYEPFYQNTNIEIKCDNKSAGERIQCDECHQTFKSISSKNKHKRSIHEGRKYPCLHCDYQAPETWTLSRHIRAKHSNL